MDQWYGSHDTAVVILTCSSSLLSLRGILLLFYSSFSLSANNGVLDFFVRCHELGIRMVQVAEIPAPSDQNAVLEKNMDIVRSEQNKGLRKNTFASYLYKDTVMNRDKIKVKRMHHGPEFPVLHHSRP